MKGILIETANDEELKMVKVFIKEHNMKGFIVKIVRPVKQIFLMM